MASKKKQKSEVKKSSFDLRSYAAKMSEFVAVHGVVLVFVAAGSMIGLALFRSRSYLNPVRDEGRYTSESGKNHYSKIDYKLVDRLQSSLTKAPIDVNQKLAPNRSNPFSE